MISINDVIIAPTLFPDGTSQVWKLPADLLEKLYKGYTIEVTWVFECEAEFLWLAQLKTLLDTYSPVINLDMPYLPYARQDKRVDNGSTFALATFARLLNSLAFNQVTVLDAHNNQRAHMIIGLVDKSAQSLIADVLEASGATTILYPDQGAVDRYSAYATNAKNNFVSAEKIREQSTGKILSIKIHGSVKGKKLLIVDDICDGGATFIGVAKAAYEAGAQEVHLYTTHGLYTKGLQVLHDAGIKRIFNRKGEVK